MDVKLQGSPVLMAKNQKYIGKGRRFINAQFGVGWWMGKFNYSCPRDRAKQKGNKGIFKKESAAKESKYPYIKKHSPVSWRVTIFV